MHSAVTKLSNYYVQYYLARREPALVYAMERTGSVATYQAIQRAGVFVIAGHRFNGVNRAHGEVSGSARWAWRHILRGKHPVNIVSLIRNPVDNLLSSFARRILSQQTPSLTNGADDLTTEQKCVDELNSLLATYVEGEHGWRKQTSWFDFEFKETTGIDVYEHPFDTQQGYGVCSVGNRRVLLLRTECPDREKAERIAHFLKVPAIDFQKPNEVRAPRANGTGGLAASESNYAAQYAMLRQSLRLARSSWQAMTATPFVKHFFSAEELQSTQDRCVRD
jgi:hypothetical protein